MAALVTGEQVEAHLSTPVVVDTLDDDNDGAIDPASLAQVIADAQAIFLASIRGIYETPLVAPIDPFVVTVVLMLVHCQLVKRFPERFKRGVAICDEAKELLKGIREREYVLDHVLRSDWDAPVCDSLPTRNYESLEPVSSDDE